MSQLSWRLSCEYIFCVDPSEMDGTSIYDQFSDILREHNDARLGIVSKLNEQGEWVRDATEAKSLQEQAQIKLDSTSFANNALLKCLARFRPIDFVIAKKLKDTKLRYHLKEKFENLAEAILLIAQAKDMSHEEKIKKVTQKEQAFNQELLKALHQADLTKGCYSKEDGEQLLYYYRNHSSLMIPARTLITITYDEKTHVLQREIQVPVTQKTDTQKDELAKKRGINPYPIQEDRDPYHAHPAAEQEASAFLRPLIAADDRALAARCRSMQLVSAKNAFIVKNELIFGDKDQTKEDLNKISANPEDVLWLARMAAPVYVGDGTTKDPKEKAYDLVQQHTIENLEQIRISVEALRGKMQNIHITCLNTNIPYKRQNTMIHHIKKATENNRGDHQDTSSFIAINLLGTLFTPQPSESLGKIQNANNFAFTQKEYRLKTAADLILNATTNESVLSAVNCASGQDRTGTAIEKATQIWMEKKYNAHGLKSENIQTMRAKGGNAAEISTHHAVGTPGMNKDSIAKNWLGKSAFTDAATKVLYLDSAKSIYENKVPEASFLTIPNQQAKNLYRRNLEAFDEALKNLKENQAINEQTKKALLAGAGKVKASILELTKIGGDGVHAKDLDDINWTLNATTKILNNPIGFESKDIKQLQGLSQAVSGSTSPLWKEIAKGLAFITTVACLASIAVTCLMLSTVTMGASNILTYLCVVALSSIISSGIAYGMSKAQTGLAESIQQFASLAEPMKADKSSEDDAHSFNESMPPPTPI